MPESRPRKKPTYTPAQAKRWEKRFLAFSYDIRALALKYRERPEDAK